ncbi:unnamed protein product [Ectocarpus fasciculatus]
MASAGSFVHGTGVASEERLLRQSKEEQDIADFMSSIDDATSGGSTSVLRGGSSAGDGGDIFLGSLSPPALQQATSTSAAGELGADDGKAIAEAFPADWLNDFEGLGLGVEGKTGSSAAPAAASQPTQSSPQGQQPQQLQQRQQQRDKDDQQEHRDATIQSIETEEILGAEPEILDNVDGGYGSGAAAAGMLMSAGGRMVSWAANTPASLVDAATGAFRGDAHHAVSRNAGDDLGNGSAAAASAADELPLDWQGTLDMVGMAEAETDATKGTSALAAAPVSELPSLPPPAAREGSFPDFVEIRDPRNVSQFPKPDNALVAKAAGGAGGGGDGQAGQGAGDSGEHAAAGQEHGQRQVLPAPLRTVEVYLRPDVTWESVSDVYMAVMLSRGLVVRHQTEKMVTAEKSADAPGDWATVKLTVGVTRDKLRTLVIQFYADTRQAPILSFAGTIARFSGRTGDDLYTAIRDVLVERQMPLSFLATDAEEVSLDPHYVRDLVGMYAHENVVNLTRYALPLEEFVRQEEERLARLEATLMPQYRANGLAPPRPTRSKPLSAYPLTTRRPPVSSCGVEEAREVMERAREHARGGGNYFPPQKQGVDVDDENVFASGGGGGGGGGGDDGGEGRGAGAGRGSSSMAEGIRSLIRATWEDVKEWCDEEAEARVRRKDAQVRDRLLAVEGHREALIAALRDGAGGSAASSTVAGREFAARFRPMAKEAVLCQCKAVHAKRVGQLYLTCNHVCFHSSVLGFTSQRVLPLLTVATISHASSVLGMDLVTLVDRGGEEHSFGITAVEAGFPERFHDLLKQCLVLCKADASRRAAQREGAAASEREPDEEQILARVQRLAKAKQLREAREAASAATSRATATTPTVAAAAVDMASPAASPHSRPGYPRPEESEVAERDTGASVGGGVVEGGAGGAMGAVGGAAAAEASSEGSGGGQDEGAGRGARGGGGRSGSMMAMGIQAFLQESQKRS